MWKNNASNQERGKGEGGRTRQKRSKQSALRSDGRSRLRIIGNGFFQSKANQEDYMTREIDNSHKNGTTQEDGRYEPGDPEILNPTPDDGNGLGD